jgi:hypothetical protein
LLSLFNNNVYRLFPEKLTHTRLQSSRVAAPCARSLSETTSSTTFGLNMITRNTILCLLYLNPSHRRRMLAQTR